MKEQISLKISEWLNTHKDEILSDLKKAVNIPSISEPDSDIKPYGRPAGKSLTVCWRLPPIMDLTCRIINTM